MELLYRVVVRLNLLTTKLFYYIRPRMRVASTKRDRQYKFRLNVYIIGLNHDILRDVMGDVICK